MLTKKKNAVFGRYPSCDMLNNALRFLFDGDVDNAIDEIVFAIYKADGYLHTDVDDKLKERNEEHFKIL